VAPHQQPDPDGLPGAAHCQTLHRRAQHHAAHAAAELEAAPPCIPSPLHCTEEALAGKLHLVKGLGSSPGIAGTGPTGDDGWGSPAAAGGGAALAKGDEALSALLLRRNFQPSSKKSAADDRSDDGGPGAELTAAGSSTNSGSGILPGVRRPRTAAAAAASARGGTRARGTRTRGDTRAHIPCSESRNSGT
jgi:hypothetical protein